ncbi:hypothetical protein ACFLUS_06115, partial [Chloroflexota bacterium]
MVSISAVSFSMFSLNLSIGIGYLGPHTSFNDSTPTSELTIPIKQLTNDPYLLSLLSWRARISTFAGREKELAVLSDWVNDRKSVISMKFICGVGGVGKTRLAAQFAEHLKMEKWATGFVKLDEPKKFRLGKKGTLIVIDYPEEFPNEIPHLFRDLAAYGNEQNRIRILFLTRQPISGWENTARENHVLNLLEKSPLELELLSGDSAHEIYISALGEASTILEKPAPEGVSVEV